MKNIHILTNNCSISNLVVIGDKLTLIRSNYYSKRYIELHGYQSKAIYITSDEDLVLGGYHFNSKYGDAPQKTNQRDIDSRKYWEEEDYYITKIILTTDQDLINDGVRAIDDEFLKWFIQNPTCEFINVELETMFKGYMTYPESINKPPFYGNLKYKIIIPKEEPKQETLEEVAEKTKGKELFKKSNDRARKLLSEIELLPIAETLEEVSEKYASSKCTPPAIMHKGLTDAVKFGAKWKAEQDKNKYSEEEMENIVNKTVDKFCTYFQEELKIQVAKEWFEQFKKKL